jgi:hypothetical protein
MTIQYRQRVWDAGSGGRWCYYEKATIDPAPLAGETSPNYTGAISAHSVVGTRDDGVVDVPNTDRLIVKWNGTDTTQFGAAIGYKNDLGTGPFSTPLLSVVAGAGIWAGRNLLRLRTIHDGGAFNTLSGGWMFPLTVPGGLPERYIVEWHVAAWAAGGGCCPHFTLAMKSADPKRALLCVTTGGTSCSVGYVRGADGRHNFSTNLGSVCAFDNPDRLAVGGTKFRFEVARPKGDNPSLWLARGFNEFGMAQTAPKDIGNANSKDHAQVDFNGETFSVIGPGMYNAGANGHVTHYDLVSLAIYKHPTSL